MNKKTIFFDIDGTLIGSSRKVTEKNQEAIRRLRENGHLVFLCTGRAPASIETSLIEIGFDGVVASAGGLITINNEFVFENYINQYLLSEVMLLFTNHHVLFSLETKEAIYQAPGIKNFFDTLHKEKFKDNLELARAQEDREKNFKRKTLQEFDLSTIPVVKMCFISPIKEDFYRCQKFLEEFFNVVIFSDPKEKYVNGEIILKHCTKGDGVKFICDRFDTDIKDSIAYGDSMNDYEMLLTAGMSIVSKKSSDILKGISDDLFEDPDVDGIYKHVKKLQLI